MIHTNDPLELQIIELLNSQNIQFIHESQKEFPQKRDRRLDFYLPDFNLYIEVKAYYTDRLNQQLQAYQDSNIILIIGLNSIKFLTKLLTK